MARIRHDYDEMNPFYRIILPHRCDQLLFGVEPKSIIDNDESPITTTATTPVIKRRRSTTRKLSSKKSKELSIDKTSDDDYNSNSNNNVSKRHRNRKHSKSNMNDDRLSNNHHQQQQSGCSSGGGGGTSSTSASPFHRHSKDNQSTSTYRSFSKSSIKQLFSSFKRFQTSTMTSDCDTQPSDFDPDDSVLLSR
ncbi:hypothetical protein BLA29_010173, partial [Euroglyphus maynei]